MAKEVVLTSSDNKTSTSNTTDSNTTTGSLDNTNTNNNKNENNTQQQLLIEQINIEKAGKRKLFHSLIKVANELQKTKKQLQPYLTEQQYYDKNWYDGGMWRSPTILPNITTKNSNSTPTKTKKSADPTIRNNNDRIETNNNYSTQAGNYNSYNTTNNNNTNNNNMSIQRNAVSLSDLFFDLVIVTAFTRVGVCVSTVGYVDLRSILYFGIFWTIWSKETSYSTRFDTSDLSATISTLVSCFVILFGSLSVQSSIYSIDSTRIMIMACFIAGFNCLLHIRVAYTVYKQEKEQEQEPIYQQQYDTTTSQQSQLQQQQHQQQIQLQVQLESSSLNQHIINYAVFNIIFTLIEFTIWLFGILYIPYDWQYRHYIFISGFLFAQRIPRAFLANDFHAACSRRGVLFILLLGFLLQSVIVVASEFFEYQTPVYEHYCFIGAACLMFFCIKLLYVDDSNTVVASDHALLVNRYAGFLFNIGNFILLFSTTVMGSGLNLLTHEYLAATAALPGPAKTLVCGGFSAVLLSTFFIKSMHVKRVPLDPYSQSLFIGAYIIQSVVMIFVVCITGAMSLGYTNNFLERMMQYESILLFVLSGFAFIVVIMDWLDEGLELILYDSVADSRMYRVHPFGIWWCLASDVSNDELCNETIHDHSTSSSYNDNFGFSRRPSAATFRLSTLSPLIGSSIADMKGLGLSSGNLNFYESIRRWDPNSSSNLRQQNYV